MQKLFKERIPRLFYITRLNGPSLQSKRGEIMDGDLEKALRDEYEKTKYVATWGKYKGQDLRDVVKSYDGRRYLKWCRDNFEGELPKPLQRLIEDNYL